MIAIKSDLCEATTGKGTNCTFRHKHFSAISSRNLCTIHFKKEENDNIDKLTLASAKDEPYLTVETLGLPTDKLSKKALNKLIRHLKKGPKASDKAVEGHIYIYSIASEQGMDYWKVGMTNKDADERLKEWETHHKVRILKRASFKVKTGTAFVERTIHLYLSYCRMLRTPVTEDKKLMYSVWYETNQVIEDVHYDTLLTMYDDSPKKLREAMVVKKKHKEWFCAPIENVLNVVNKITSL
jgi:hypothetical protein